MLCHDLAELAALRSVLLPLFFWHNPDTNALVPPLIMPVYRFFLHKCIPYCVNNTWLNFYTKLVLKIQTVDRST